MKVLKTFLTTIIMTSTAIFGQANGVATEAAPPPRNNLIAVPFVLFAPSLALVGLQYERRFVNFEFAGIAQSLTFGVDYRTGSARTEYRNENKVYTEQFQAAALSLHYFFAPLAIGDIRTFNGFYIGPVAA